MSVQFARTIDNNVYPRKALAEARDAFKNHCTVKISPITSREIIVTIFVDSVLTADDARQIILEFWNYALDRACQIYVEQH